MKFSIEIEREEDGRWIAEVTDLPGVVAYGATREEAESKVQAILVSCNSKLFLTESSL